MKRNYKIGIPLLFVMILALVVPGQAKKKALSSAWTEQPLKIDGSSADWGEDGFVKYEKYQIDRAFRNDGDYLYIIFTFKDPKFMSTINSSGMTVWLNNRAKKKKRYGIKFLKRRISPDTFIRMIEKKHGPLPTEKKEEIRKKEFYTIYQSGVVNKDDEQPLPIQLGSGQSPAFRVKPGQGTMTYEFRIPLEKLEGKTSGIGTTPGQTIALGFQWGGLTKEMREARAQQRGYESSSGRGGVSDNIPGGHDAGAAGLTTGGDTRGIRVRGGPKQYTLWTMVQLAEAK